MREQRMCIYHHSTASISVYSRSTGMIKPAKKSSGSCSEIGCPLSADAIEIPCFPNGVQCSAKRSAQVQSARRSTSFPRRCCSYN